MYFFFRGLLFLAVALFLTPCFVIAQVEIWGDQPVATETVSGAEAFKNGIPSRLKTGKPQVYKHYGLWGYILNDSMLIPFEYEQLDSRYSDVMVAKKPRQLYGAINKQGQTVIPFEYVALQHTSGECLLGWKKDAGYGLIAHDGGVRVPFEYKNALLIPQDSAHSIWAFYGPGKQRFVRLIGNGQVETVLECAFEDASLERVETPGVIAVKQSGRWGVMDLQGRLLVPCAYDHIGRVRADRVFVFQNGRSGVLDFEGRNRIPIEYEEVFDRFPNGLYHYYRTVDGEKRSGLLNDAGKIVLPAECDDIRRVYNTSYLTARLNGLWGLIDTTGQWRIPAQFYGIQSWMHSEWRSEQNDLRLFDRAYGQYFAFTLKEGGKIGLWHIDRGQIFGPENDYYRIHHPDGPIIVTRNERDALYTIEGRPISGFDYGSMAITRPEALYATTNTNGQRTVVSTRTGKPVQDETYDDWYFHVLSDGYFYTKKNGLSALHAPDGRRLTPHEYSTALSVCGDISAVQAILPPGRKIIACFAKFDDMTGVAQFALDDQGQAYPYNKK